MQFLLFFWIAATLRVQFARWMWPSSPVPPRCRRVWCVAGLLLATDTFCRAVYKDSLCWKGLWTLCWKTAVAQYNEKERTGQHICNVIQWTNKTKTLFNRSQPPLFPAESLALYTVHEFPRNSQTRVHPLPDFVLKKLIVLPNGFVVVYTGTFYPISDPFRLPAAMRDASTIFNPFPPAQRIAIDCVLALIHISEPTRPP